MELTVDLLTFTEAPVHTPVEAEWYHRIVRKRATYLITMRYRLPRLPLDDCWEGSREAVGQLSEC